MKTKLCVLGVVALIVWGAKRYYADARADDLWWILSPTAGLVGVTTGTAFAATPGEGYVSHERMFVIEKSCAGVNFMIAAFVTTVFALFHRVVSATVAGWVVLLGLTVSYSAAVLVNTARIAGALWLLAHPLPGVSLTAADFHRVEGITVYFVGLVLLYELVLHLERRVAAARATS